MTVNVTKLNANCTCEITGLTITPEEPKITMDVDDESGSVDLKATASRNDVCPVEGHLTNEPVIAVAVTAPVLLLTVAFVLPGSATR